MAKNKSDRSKEKNDEIATASRMAGGAKFLVGLVMALAFLSIVVLGYELATRVWPEVFVSEEASLVQEASATERGFDNAL